MTSEAARRRRQTLLCLALLAGTVLLYAPVREHDFVRYDDPEYVLENAHVRRGLTSAGIAWAFTHFHSANWHPLTWITHMVDCQVFGLDAGAHLVVNVALHGFAAVLLFLFLARATGAFWRSAFVAALFAFHPLRVESVAWVSERKDVLSALLWMATLHAYLWYVRAPSARRMALVALTFAAGLLAKPMLVTLPFVLLLLDVWPFARPRTVALLREKAPLFALVLLSCVVTIAAQYAGGAVVPLAHGFGVSYRVQNAIVSYATYLWQTLWPVDLAVFYPPRTPVPAGEVALSAAVLLAIGALVARLAARRPYLPVGWLWYLGVLVPVIGLVWVGEQSRADRFTYLPQIGIGIMVAWGANDLLAAWPRRAWVLAPAAALLLLGWVATTRAQIAHWRDTTTLFRHALTATRDNYVVHANLAAELARLGQTDEALAHFDEALRIKGEFPKARLGLGALLARMGRLDEAIAHYEYALAHRPDSPVAHLNYGLALVALGRGEEALPHYQEALRLDPTYAKVHVAQATVLEQLGRGPEAIVHLRQAIAIRPDLAEAHGNLAIALEAAGRPDEALAHYRETVRLLPEDPRAHYNLAAMLEQRGDTAAAVEHYRAALRGSPDSSEIRAALERLASSGGGVDG